MKKRIILLTVLLLAGTAVFACEMTYKLVDSDGKSVHLSPDKTVFLDMDKNYKLIVSFKENHRRCEVPPEDTIFLLDDEKWNYGKDNLPLVLERNYSWDTEKPGNYFAEIMFSVREKSDFSLEVLRECDRKGGYDEYLNFSVK